MIEPCFDDFQVGRAFDAGDRAVACNQQRPRYFAMPLRIDLVAQALDEAVVNIQFSLAANPVCASIVATAFAVVGNEIGIDDDQIEVGSLAAEACPNAAFRLCTAHR